LFTFVHAGLHERTGKFFGEELDLSDLARACSGDLKLTRTFALDHHLDFNELAEVLWNAGVSCDCEVLIVARKRISADTPLPVPATV
jgi:hypothetical protein